MCGGLLSNRQIGLLLEASRKKESSSVCGGGGGEGGNLQGTDSSGVDFCSGAVWGGGVGGNFQAPNPKTPNVE